MAEGNTIELGSLFGDYRAEWSAELFQSFFIRPTYFDRLVSKRPSLLIGGRGTGKTTALRALRFDAPIRAAAVDPNSNTEYFGIYIRINKNRVRAFEGEGLDRREWDHAFAHYFNLLACLELCDLTRWLGARSETADVSNVLGLTAAAFGSSWTPATVQDLRKLLDAAVIELEVFVNNPKNARRPIFSMAETPLRVFSQGLRDCGLLGTGLIFCCVDEYENLTNSQQSIVNTYLKHSEPPLTFKVGIRRNGLRTRSTIDQNDQISTPDDYAEIDITSEQQFDEFATSVAELRLRYAQEAGLAVPATLAQLLPELSYQAEAKLLGAESVAEDARAQLSTVSDAEIAAWAVSATTEDLLLLAYWAAGHGGDLPGLARNRLDEPEAWKTRFGNYSHSTLFWLSRGRKGARTRKHYCGADTFLALSSGNIRYFLELIDESLRAFLLDHREHVQQVVIPGETQTVAAQTVGRRRLGQLDGLSEYGMDLKRFVLAVGKVFFEFARDPAKAPETNAFVLGGAPAARGEVELILRDGVSHLAFEATPRTKATSLTEMRDEEYRIHPIYAPFFEYSYRRKRRTTFLADDLLRLGTAPRRAIKSMLGETTNGAELPAQLAMFDQFYNGTDDE